MCSSSRSRCGKRPAAGHSRTEWTQEPRGDGLPERHLRRQGPGRGAAGHGQAAAALSSRTTPIRAWAAISNIGIDGPWDVHRILGTVPVDEDGSANFKVPANTPIAVQPLDEHGRALQLMRSWFTAMPGEHLSCVGCHDNQNTTPLEKPALATRRAPSEITPWYGPTRGFSFQREVQPVLDKYLRRLPRRYPWPSAQLRRPAPQVVSGTSRRPTLPCTPTFAGPVRRATTSSKSPWSGTPAPAS